jgi:hypothetical protein
MSKKPIFELDEYEQKISDAIDKAIDNGTLPDLGDLDIDFNDIPQTGDKNIDYSDIPETDKEFWKDAEIIMPKVS